MDAKLVMYFAYLCAKGCKVCAFFPNRRQISVNFPFWNLRIGSRSGGKRRWQMMLIRQHSHLILKSRQAFGALSCSICPDLILNSVNFSIEIGLLFLLLNFEEVANALGIRFYMLWRFRLFLRFLCNADAELGLFLAWPLADVVQALVACKQIVAFQVFS